MHKYLDEAYNDTMRILTENIEVLEAMAQALLEVETINHKQVENLLNIILSMRREKSRSKRNRNFHHLHG